MYVGRISTLSGKSAGKIRFAALIFLVWTAVGVFEAVPELLKEDRSWYVLVASLIDHWAWALITPALLAMVRKFDSKEQNMAHLLLLFLMMSIPFSLIHTLLAGLLQYPIPKIWWSPLRNSQMAPYYFLGSWQVYCAAAGLLLALSKASTEGATHDDRRCAVGESRLGSGTKLKQGS